MKTEPRVLIKHLVSEEAGERLEPEWLAEQRLEAAALAEALDLPELEKVRLQNWSIGDWGRYRGHAPLEGVEELPSSLQRWVSSENVLVQWNSGNVFSRLSGPLREQGVILMDLELAANLYPERVQPYLMHALKSDENVLTAVHAALWSGGAFVYVPPGVQIEEPLQILAFADEAGIRFMPHVLIVADENSSVTVVENVTSMGRNQEQSHNGVIEVFVKRGARAYISSLHHLNEAVTDLTYRRAYVEQEGSVEWILGEMNEGHAMSDTTSILLGRGANARLKTVSVGAGNQKMHITTKIVHVGQNSISDMFIRAVMREQSTAILNGITKIEKGAKGTNGQQTEKILMLHPEARGDANPILLIDEDDVKAGHAASVGQVHPEQVYYMMSRGISRAEAERLIVYGFLAPVIDEVPLEGAADQLRLLVEHKLGQASPAVK
ncbi:Fe-S cluster assembly protein SufD [Paenibacillus sp. HW567]|uniref:Fe-S cluster assembly protein SufD n=1 Tax=Paenibacillus sp. HW567 TaxID=1034769 RepID=UPI0003680A30|nr:Fe-S cluster assembly protein SufD [Paenibacillus sp. HW567]